MLSVLQVNNYGHVRGGSDRYFLELIRALTVAGVRVSSFSTADPRNVAASSARVPAFDVASPTLGDLPRFFYSRRARAEMRRLLAETPVDVAHLHIYYGQLTASILAPLAERGIPIVQTLHEYRLLCPISTRVRGDEPCEECSRGAYWRAVRHRCNRGSLLRSLAVGLESYAARGLGAMERVDRFVAVSDYLRRRLLASGVSSDRVSVLHNFVDVDAFRPATEAGDYFVYVGRVERIKGIATLLAAMERVGGRLVVVGDGEFRPEAQRWAESRGLDVDWVGFQGDASLRELVRKSRCLVVPSEWEEPFGLVILEGYALGRPVVATRVGGIPEVVRAEETGLLVPAGDAEALAEALRWMRDHPERAVEMGRRGRALAEREFGPELHCQRLGEIYRVLRARGRGPKAERIRADR